MDTENLIAHARARFDHAANRRLLKEKYQARMTFAHAGGLWCAGPELMTLLHICEPAVPQVILDLYNNPIRIVPQDLLELARQRWQEQMNAWLIEYEQLNQAR
jgi:hypothetical protein